MNSQLEMFFAATETILLIQSWKKSNRTKQKPAHKPIIHPRSTRHVYANAESHRRHQSVRLDSGLSVDLQSCGLFISLLRCNRETNTCTLTNPENVTGSKFSKRQNLLHMRISGSGRAPGIPRS